MLVNVMNKLC